MSIKEEDIDYVCMTDGKVYQGPDAGDTIENPGAYAFWNEHPISHGICPEHASEEDPRKRMDVWAGLLGEG